VLYEGMGFAFDYNSARGHVFSVIDTDETDRPKPFVGCFSCKSPEIHAAVAEHGLDFMTTTYDEFRPNVHEPVSCFNCHANEPGEIHIVASFIPDFLGDDIYKADPIDLACAQCHIEYHWDPETRTEVFLPYNSIESMHPDVMLEYFNNLTMPDGSLYYDFINPRSGVRQIKIQHPEFETYYSEGSVHVGQYNCADCHMPQETNAAGNTFTSHFWASPLNNPSVMDDSSCIQCHADFETFVRDIQGPVMERTAAIGNKLAEFMEEIVELIETGGYDEEKMDEVRFTFRNAQFYWDFVFVENSNGAHNSRLSHLCLEKAEQLYEEARALFAAM
jgi:nitrite reductase (cytochrome c-552)